MMRTTISGPSQRLITTLRTLCPLREFFFPRRYNLGEGALVNAFGIVLEIVEVGDEPQQFGQWHLAGILVRMSLRQFNTDVFAVSPCQAQNSSPLSRGPSRLARAGAEPSRW